MERTMEHALEKTQPVYVTTVNPLGEEWTEKFLIHIPGDDTVADIRNALEKTHKTLLADHDGKYLSSGLNPLTLVKETCARHGWQYELSDPFYITLRA